jgi:hypothetical protein
VPIMVARNDGVARVPFERLSDRLKRVTLTSKKFDKWIPLFDQNVSKQVKALTQDGDHFTLFCSHALHESCAEPRDSSHVIKVDLEEGWGLGEIKELKRFWVVIKEEAMADYEERYHQPNSRAETNLFLQYCQDTDPNSKVAVVMFCGEVIHQIIAVVLPQEPHLPGLVLAPRESDREALRAFCNLVRVELPRVESPELH